MEAKRRSQNALVGYVRQTAKEQGWDAERKLILAKSATTEQHAPAAS